MKLNEEGKKIFEDFLVFYSFIQRCILDIRGGDTMQFNTSTDYAIRLVLCLVKESKTVSSSKLSTAIGVSSRYLLQISAKLRDAGLIEVTYGGNGGFRLLHPANTISLFDIVIIMEGSIVDKPFHGDVLTQEKFKTLNEAYKYIGEVLINILKSITIESLLSRSVEEWHLTSYPIGEE